MDRSTCLIQYEALNTSIKRYKYIINNNLSLLSEKVSEFTKKLNIKLLKDFQEDNITDKIEDLLPLCSCCLISEIITGEDKCDACYIKDAMKVGIVEDKRDFPCMRSYFIASDEELFRSHKDLNYKLVLQDLLLVKEWIKGNE